MFDELFSRFRRTPAAQALLRRVEAGGALTWGGVHPAGHAFLAAWLRKEFPQRPIVLVAENLKAQGTLHQDLETWLGGGRQKIKDRGERIENSRTLAGSAASPPAPLSSTLYSQPSPSTPLLFFPAWEILPHEDKLPHADVISERLETLVELMRNGECGVRNEDRAHAAAHSAFRTPPSALITTSITALLQRTFPPAMLAARTRTLRRGGRVDPLDLIEWLEDNGYDSEVQVSAKGEISLRGGIVDVFPLTSPWPVRLEFFGDELESLRTFDPVTQVSRAGGELDEIILPPAGELGVLKREVERGEISNQCSVISSQSERTSPIPHSPFPIPSRRGPFATLLDYLPDDAIVLLSDPEAIEAHAQTYAEQIPDGSPFFASWAELRGELLRREMTVVALLEEEVISNQCSVFSVQATEPGDESVEEAERWARSPGFSRPSAPPAEAGTPCLSAPPPSPISYSQSPIFASLEAFRPISDRLPAQEIALAQRQMFFQQLASWLRQGFYVQVVCNNDGEAQRFREVWQEIGLGGTIEGEGRLSGGQNEAAKASSRHPQVSNLSHDEANWSSKDENWLPEQGICSPEQGIWSPEQGIWSPEQGICPPEQGIWSPEQGICPTEQGSWSPEHINLPSKDENSPSHGLNQPPQAEEMPPQAVNMPPIGQKSPAYAAKSGPRPENSRRLRGQRSVDAPREPGHGADAGAVLPHPSPLPPGEGAHATALDAAQEPTGPKIASSRTPVARARPAQSDSLPLPAGEGRGEGERLRHAMGSLLQTRDPRPQTPDPTHPAITLGTLARGFLCEAGRFVVVTDAEVFGRYKVQRPRRMKSPHALAARSALDINFTELEEGDYVVHLQHGIGRFKGLKLLPTGKPGRARHHLEAEALRPKESASAQGAALPHPGPLPLGEGANPTALGSPSDASGSRTASHGPARSNLLPLPAGEGRGEGEKSRSPAALKPPPPVEEGIECLVLEYASSDTDREPPKLYVPITEAHLVSKYVGAGKVRPPLNQLGGKRWEKTKQQAERAVRDLASELLAIQAKRAVQPGHAFGPDTPWQREFEGSFLFEETADQLRAIEEAKRDLEIAKPMDRLICGDVGFGKTEVAIRAAFKAVMGGKQVAVLVPTTVLAQQHYNTFRERMADYPVRVELLSRYRTRQEQLKVVEQLAAGAVDIVVGTHRLVQSDVTFKDLGLVVIDEEQRFGVLHKEKFKLMRTHVDVLTLSATPIPRTLYLALTGARDMSTIQTPPQDRLPVETLVEHYDERIIRDAIRRELERGGQVFFLHNRVTTIEAMRSRLAGLVPQARIVVGHGQMSGDELEDVMTQFVNGEADVLLSTTIIESGLDIPNANTLIIDRADRFGLSQLYQLRGRVGRYKHQAFAYLLLPRHARLLTDVRKRMSAIKQYAQLGSGFKIAMRDLEIRGAGNLLGAQQSGHITAVGFELYCNLLKQSVAAQKGEQVKPKREVTLRLDFLAMNPVEEETAVRGAGNVNEAASVPTSSRTTHHAPRSTPAISVPRDTGMWVYDTDTADEPPDTTPAEVHIPRAGAFLPAGFIPEAQHRIETYRRLAQAGAKAELDALARELRDRYGKPPRPVELLLLAAELKLLAGERGVDGIETKAGKLMLHRRGDFLQPGGKFPRLTKTEPLAALKEIKKLLLAL